MMKDIKCYEGLYSITSDGEVWSYRTQKFLKQRRDKDGYFRVTLIKDGELQTFHVHRLVAEAFVPNPDNLPEVSHIDESRTKNCASNLIWSTHADNCAMPLHKERIRAAKNGKPVRCINTDVIYANLKEAAEINGVASSNICAVVRGKAKSAYGCKWEYVDDVALLDNIAIQEAGA